ncbi:MAG TPA: polysaccharide deacetylase family protein [Bacillota bacterium]|nr:polysaccharide deacetylase family protein [Bacillota bacterium]
MWLLDSYVTILVMSYLIGALPAIRLPAFVRPVGIRAPWLSPVLRGMAAVGLARVSVGTPIAITAAGLAVVVGATWSLLVPGRRGLTVPAAVGVGLVISPAAACASGGIAYIIARALRKRRDMLPLVPTVAGGILYPPLVWLFERFDLHLILAAVLALICIYEALPALPRSAGDRGTRKTQDTSPTLALFRAVMSRMATTLLVIGLAAAILLNRYVYRGFGMGVEIFRRGSNEFSLVALTFDDGPNPEYTPFILDTLKAKGVHATFFLVGEEVERYPDLARRIVEEGHEVGSHTHSHRNMMGLQAHLMKQEIVCSEDAITRACGEPPRLFRPPRGLYDERLIEQLRERHYALALWSISSMDWTEASEASMVHRLSRVVRNGDVILFHDSGGIVANSGGSRTNTVRALPHVIDRLRDRGFAFATVSQLMFISGLAGDEPPESGGK